MEEESKNSLKLKENYPVYIGKKAQIFSYYSVADQSRVAESRNMAGTVKIFRQLTI